MKKFIISAGLFFIPAGAAFCDELEEAMGNTASALSPELTKQAQTIMGSMTVGGLVWGLIFSAIGGGFFMYGKRKKNMKLMFAAAALTAYPYVVQDTNAIIVVGVILTVVAYLFRKK